MSNRQGEDMKRGGGHKAPNSVIKEAIDAWIRHLQTSLFPGISEKEIAELVGPVARDDAWIYQGGSGRRSRLYRIDDYLQARFDFDDQDQLLSYAVYESRENWLKGPDGTLQWGFQTSDIELWFPKPLQPSRENFC
jgi:hypothetical protein